LSDLEKKKKEKAGYGGDEMKGCILRWSRFDVGPLPVVVLAGGGGLPGFACLCVCECVRVSTTGD
jgi:hypothetical protein